jgi:hypothetical protein
VRLGKASFSYIYQKNKNLVTFFVSRIFLPQKKTMKILVLILFSIAFVLGCVPMDGYCKFVGEPCTINDVCATGICYNGVCATDMRNDDCRTDWDCKGYMSSMFCVNNRCLPRLLTKDSCVTHEQCLGSMMCVNGECEGALFGKPCQYTEECAAGLWCKSGKCDVKPSRGGFCYLDGTCEQPMDQCIDNSCVASFSAREGDICHYSTMCVPGTVCSSTTYRCVIPPQASHSGCQSCDIGTQACRCKYGTSNTGESTCCLQHPDITDCIGERISLTTCVYTNKCAALTTYDFNNIGAMPGQCVRRECASQLASLALCQARALGYAKNCTAQIKQALALESPVIIVGYTTTGDFAAVPLKVAHVTPLWVRFSNSLLIFVCISLPTFCMIAAIVYSLRHKKGDEDKSPRPAVQSSLLNE